MTTCACGAKFVADGCQACHRCRVAVERKEETRRTLAAAMARLLDAPRLDSRDPWDGPNLR